MKRRIILAGLAGTAAFPARAVYAQGWQAKYPELVLGMVPSENSDTLINAWSPFVAYLGRQIGTKVTLRVATDYAGVVEGQRSGNVHIGNYGPAAFARALMTGVKITAFAIDIYAGGARGYYSGFFVRKDSPYKKIEDLKGAVIGVVDPNSMSGYDMPFFTLDRMGIDPETFFSKVLITGSHDNAAVALAQGTVQCCVNWYDGPGDSNITRMIKAGVLKNKDGSVPTEADFPLILKSDLIINSPTAYLDSLPDDLKKAIAQAWLDGPKNAPDAFRQISAGKNQPWQPIDNAAYDDTIKLVQFMDRRRKSKG